VKHRGPKRARLGPRLYANRLPGHRLQRADLNPWPVPEVGNPRLRADPAADGKRPPVARQGIVAVRSHGFDAEASPLATRLTALPPQGGATGVSPTVTMRIEFNGAMAAGMEQYVDLHQRDVSGAVHPMTCSWSADRSVLTCTPTTPLQSGTHYTLHLGAGMMSSAGSSLDIGPGLEMGGAWMQSSAVGGMHAGQPTSTMGSGCVVRTGPTECSSPFRRVDPRNVRASAVTRAPVHRVHQK
jgi:hypothetical protein